MEFAMYLRLAAKDTASFWHDVPLDIEQLDDSRTINVVIEIPKGHVDSIPRYYLVS
jgi:hypothetical protein